MKTPKRVIICRHCGEKTFGLIRLRDKEFRCPHCRKIMILDRGKIV